MDRNAKPNPEELRKVQAALDAVNLAYAYFTPLTPESAKTETGEYYAYVKAA